MRYFYLILALVLWAHNASAMPQGFGPPNKSLGLNLPFYPDLLPVPGYPAYYAPRMNANYFFYDGMFWVFQDDLWYASPWYNGPWHQVDPVVLPAYLLRIPVRYYRQPPVYFRFWALDEPPRWADHWGKKWQLRTAGWRKLDRRSVRQRLPLPIYQRRFSGDQYPDADFQWQLQQRNYRYQPKDPQLRKFYQHHLPQRRRDKNKAPS